METRFDLTAVEKLLTQPKKIPVKVKRSFYDWLRFVEFNGIAIAQKTRRFRDHQLKGKRKSQRSVYLDAKWRVIYRLEKTQVLIIKIEDITAHDYRVR